MSGLHRTRISSEMCGNRMEMIIHSDIIAMETPGTSIIPASKNIGMLKTTTGNKIISKTSCTLTTKETLCIILKLLNSKSTGKSWVMEHLTTIHGRTTAMKTT